MVLVWADTTNKRERFQEKQRGWTIGVVVVSAVVCFLPVSEFQSCSIGDFPVYCGYCYDRINIGFEILFFYIIPILLGIVLSIILIK